MQTFLESLNQYGTHLVLSLLTGERERAVSAPNEYTTAISWVEQHGMVLAPDHPELLDRVVDGLVEMVSIGKGVSKEEATEEVIQDGVSVRTWTAWATEHPEDLVRLTRLF